MQTPSPDPFLVAQQKRAEADNRAALQDKLTTQTSDLLRYYGQQNAFAGTSMKPPILRGAT